MDNRVLEKQNTPNFRKTDSGHRIVRVKDVVWVSSSIFELQVFRDGIEFRPGDCMSVFGTDRTTSRPYSIASGIHEPAIRFLIKYMEDSSVTDYLADRRPGDEIKVSVPYGWFHPGLQNGSDPFIFIATGTGISPFLSYIRSYPDTPPEKVLYGVRQRENAIGLDVLRETAATELAVSQETDGNFYQGRVTGLLGGLPLEKNIHYYLCGLDSMIDEVSHWLQHKGIDAARIHREVFFYSSGD